MARKTRTSSGSKRVEALQHQASGRKNIPIAELQSVVGAGAGVPLGRDHLVQPAQHLDRYGFLSVGHGGSFDEVSRSHTAHVGRYRAQVIAQRADAGNAFDRDPERLALRFGVHPAP